MRNKAIERLGETIKEKSRKWSNGEEKKTYTKRNDGLFKRSHGKGMWTEEVRTRVWKETRKKGIGTTKPDVSTTARNVQAISRPVEKSTTAVPDDVSNVYAATTTTKPSTTWTLEKGTLNSFCCCFYYTYKARFSLCRLNLTCLPSNDYYKNCASLLLIMRRVFFTISTGIFTQPLFINASWCSKFDESWNVLFWRCILMYVLACVIPLTFYRCQ